MTKTPKAKLNGLPEKIYYNNGFYDPIQVTQNL